MIKFFRKIRQKLLTENKFSKYLIYAFGEVVLVIIGIIIALQINNWNESRKAFNLELQLYGKIVDDLNDQYKSTNTKISWMKSMQNTHYRLYNEINGLVEEKQSLDFSSLEWILPFQFDFSEKHIESLTSISNDEIRSILKTYIGDEKEAKKAYDEWIKLKEQRLRPFLYRNGIHDLKAAYNDNRYDFYALTTHTLIDHNKLKEHYGSVELNELLYELRFKTSWVFTKLNEFKKSNKYLMKVLESELELHEVKSWKNKKKYSDLILDADQLYDLKDYQQSANRYKEAFALKTVKANPIDQYNAACTFALAKDIESAFYQLFDLAKGKSKFKDNSQLTTDSDLGILHQDKRWEELITIVTSNKEESKKEK